MNNTPRDILWGIIHGITKMGTAIYLGVIEHDIELHRRPSQSKGAYSQG